MASYIYVYSNNYFNSNNIRKIGSTKNPYIRLQNYTTFYRDYGYFEYLYQIDTENPYEIDSKIRNNYLNEINTYNIDKCGGIEIYLNDKIKDRLLSVFEMEKIRYLELNPNEPPLHSIKKSRFDLELIDELKESFSNLISMIPILKKPSKPINLKNIPLKNYVIFPLTPFISSIEIQVGKNMLYLNTENCNFPNCFLEKIVIKSSFGFGNKRKLNQEIRNSFTEKCQLKFETIEDIEQIINEKIEKIIPKSILKKSNWKNDLIYDMILYEKGGHFISHIDKQINNNHYGTLLIIPPQIKNLEHKGGDLVLKLEKEVIISSSENKEWIIVAFPLGIEHKILEVTEGRRLVFKTELFLEEFYKLETDYGIVDNSIQFLEEINTD